MSEVPSDNQIRSVLDGVTAESIYPQCHLTHHSDGRVSYHHRLITPAIVAAGRKDVVACYWYHTSWADQMRFMVTQLELPDPGG